ncbi:ArsR family transcriptional regulator [Mycobacterium yunnanensis]|uniref:ArsR family transcriptional regulator n=1 Tax=Mycobacterium yunnanensis TaxID=368477 RepID=A0A9X2Z7Q5_9MYCO|nr:ArsR family transcriptional regulator [Mycobacterium yunnanensis]MCV7423032.1 ArsR family transcriptional regulator [Mycobacterium yunnanensis]
MNVEPVVSEDTPFPTHPVAGVQQLLGALADPVRLEMVRRLMNAGAAMPCARLYDGINKSTASHHFTTLREVGLIERLVVEGHILQRLRVQEVDAAVPGLLRSIVDAVNGDVSAPTMDMV